MKECIDSSSIKRSYDLRSAIHIKGLLSLEECEMLENLFDDIYINDGFDVNNEGRKPIPGGVYPFYKFYSPLEYFSGFAELFARKSIIPQIMRSILGHDVQFSGSETINVWNDTHGPHRDYFFPWDVAKILISLNGRPGCCSREASEATDTPGAFAVFPGSHHLLENHAARANYLTKWPSPAFSCFMPTPSTLVYQDGKLIDIPDMRTRYTSFSTYPFEAGDAIIFSTRAIHALHPLPGIQRPMKFIGLLWQEGFKSITKNKLERIFLGPESGIDTYDAYSCLPYIEELIGAKMRSLDTTSFSFPRQKGVLANHPSLDNETYNFYSPLEEIHKHFAKMSEKKKQLVKSDSFIDSIFYNTLNALSKRSKYFRDEPQHAVFDESKEATESA